MKTIKIKYLSDIIPLVKKGNWVDLRASEDVRMQKGEFRLIPLGVAMQLPDGYEAHIVPRSSTYKNFRLIQSNHFGVIDNEYCGNNDQWYFSAIALEDTAIQKNDRICQFRIMKIQPKLEFEQVENLESEDRGGFGSSGIK